jgi:hypothetical protein
MRLAIRLLPALLAAACASAPRDSRDAPFTMDPALLPAAPSRPREKMVATDVAAFLSQGEAVDLRPALDPVRKPSPPRAPDRVSAAASDEDLTKKTQNPVADLISVPFQNNLNFGVGPDDDLQYILNVQPVWPFKLSEDWNLITRTILPLMYQPELAPGVGDEFGLGDTLFTGFFSPSKPKKIIWGAGPAVLFPTSTDDSLGVGEWGLGPAAVVLTIDGQWVYGALLNNVWTFAGEFSTMTFQPFVNYNLPSGWYLVSAPIVTANWDADRDNIWTVPIGGGMGKIFKFGKMPVNCQAQIFYNIETPDGGPEWQLRIQFQLLFPK